MNRLKRCKGPCGKLLPLDDFYRDRKAKDGRMGKCKKCHNARLVEKRRTNPRSRVSHAQASKRYKKKNPSKVRAKDRKYYHEGGGKKKNEEWKKKNPERAREILKKSEAKNRIKVKARQAVRNAIRKGEIRKPAKCQGCGKETTELDAHHYKGYIKRHWLDIKWICEDCHGKTRRKDG